MVSMILDISEDLNRKLNIFKILGKINDKRDAVKMILEDKLDFIKLGGETNGEEIIEKAELSG